VGKLTLALVIAAGAAVAGLSVQAADAPQTTVAALTTTPLTSDPSREVKIINVTWPPGADSRMHFHPGDQYTTVQEGEVAITIQGEGEEEHVYHAGEVAHIDPMVVHRTRNVSNQSARTTEVFIVAKGKPLSMWTQ
jgi:quercetin dioxygenase-like cupin family protein